MSAPKMCCFLYNLKCIDSKSHKCTNVEYKYVYCGYFDTKCMSVNNTEIPIIIKKTLLL